MKKVLYVVLDQYADFEAAYITTAVQMLGKGQFENKIVSLTKEPVKSIGGFSVIPDYDLQSVPNDYDALILIGGMSWHNEETIKLKSLIENTIKKNKILGAICDACRYLGTIGALNYGKHTANDFNELKLSAGNVYTNAEQFIHSQSVSDKNIITANGTATLEFAKNILTALNISTESEIKDWYDFHKLGLYAIPLSALH